MKMSGAIVLLAMLAGASASAQETDDLSNRTDDELIGMISDPERRWIEDSCGVGVPLLQELRARQPKNEGFLEAQFMARAFCADERKDFAEAADYLAKFERSTGRKFFGLGLVFDTRANRPESILKRLNGLASSGAPDDFADISPEVLGHALRLGVREGHGREFAQAALRLYQSDGYKHFQNDSQMLIAFEALAPATKTGNPGLVTEILGQVRDPYAYSALLASREYEAIWPQIEERVGERYARITDEYRQWTRARLDAEPSDRDRFSAAAHALYFDGRFEEAIALARQWRERPNSFNEIEEGDGWAINIEAYALDSLGRTAEADALFDRLAELPADEHPWVVNFVINRALRLVGQERFAEGLEAARLARTVAEEYGSPYARMLVSAAHACAHGRLGNTAEAERELTFLRENREEVITVAAEALMCLGHDREAAGLLIEGLRSEESRTTVADALQPQEVELFYTQSLLPDASELLAKNAQLRAEFERHARVIPERLFPAASTKRVPLRR